MIPFSVYVFERGAYGVPQPSGRADNLRGRIDSLELSIADLYGFEGMRCGWNASAVEALDWLRFDQLMRACEVYGPDGALAWEGVLAEVEVQIGRLTLRVSLKDMANRLIVRYNTPQGDHGATSVYEHDGSIYLFGRKDRVQSLSSTSDTGAANRAQTALNLIAFPRSKESTTSGSGKGGEVSVKLTFVGRYALLDWLTTESTSTTITNNATQIAALLANYNSVNTFFGGAVFRATLPSDVEYIDPDTTYRTKIENLLAQGSATHEPLSWGIYEDGRLIVERSAAADPTTVHYYEHSRTGVILDAYGNEVAPWLLRPNKIAQVVDVLDVEPPSGAIDGATRKHVARVTLRVSSSGISVELEPSEDESLDKILASPAGSGPAGTSERQAAVERAISSAARPRFEPADNPSRYSGGVWQPGAGGTGKANTGTIDIGAGSVDTGGGSILTGGGSILTGGGSIDTGGGSIDTGGGDVTNTGGGPIDLGTGAGIGGAGSSGVSTSGGGTSGRLAQWLTSSSLADSTLAKSGAGVLTLTAAAAAALTLAGTGSIDFAGSGSGKVLQHDGTKFVPTTLTPAALGAVDGSGTAGRLAQWSDSDTLTSATLIKSGAGVLTLSASATASLTLAGTGAVDFAGASSGKALVHNGTAFVPTALTAADVGAVDGSGTSGRIAQWSGGSTLTSATLIKSGAGVLTLSASATASLTLAGTGSVDFAGAASGKVLQHDGTKFAPATLTAADVGAVDGTGTANRIAVWLDSNTIEAESLIKSGAGVLTLTAAATAGLTLIGTNTLDFSGAALGDVLTYNGTKFVSQAPAASGVSGSGANTRVAFWTGSSTLSSDSALVWNSTNNALGIGTAAGPGIALEVIGAIRTNDQLIVGSSIKTASGIAWDFGPANANPISATHTAQVSIGGVTYHMLLWDGGV
jgi:hypothetical protein